MPGHASAPRGLHESAHERVGGQAERVTPSLARRRGYGAANRAGLDDMLRVCAAARHSCAKREP